MLIKYMILAAGTESIRTDFIRVIFSEENGYADQLKSKSCLLVDTLKSLFSVTGSV